MRIYTDSDIMVIGIFYGVPSQTRRKCSTAVDQIFCAPTNEGATFYGLFVKFLLTIIELSYGNIYKYNILENTLYNIINSGPYNYSKTISGIIYEKKIMIIS